MVRLLAGSECAAMRDTIDTGSGTPTGLVTTSANQVQRALNAIGPREPAHYGRSGRW
jgi:hypothetical protein